MSGVRILGMVESVDTQVLKTCGESRAGSSPAPETNSTMAADGQMTGDSAVAAIGHPDTNRLPTFFRA